MTAYVLILAALLLSLLLAMAIGMFLSRAESIAYDPGLPCGHRESVGCECDARVSELIARHER